MNSTDTKKKSPAELAVRGFAPLLAALLLTAAAVCIGYQYFYGDLPDGALSIALLSLTAVNAVCLLLAVLFRGAALGFVRFLQVLLLLAELAAAGVLAVCRFSPGSIEPYRAALGSGGDTLTAAGTADTALILGLAAFAILFRCAVLAFAGGVARSRKGQPVGATGAFASLLSVLAGLALAALAVARAAGISFAAVPAAENADAALRGLSLDFARYGTSDAVNLILTVALPLFYILFGLRAGRFSRAVKKAAPAAPAAEAAVAAAAATIAADPFDEPFNEPSESAAESARPAGRSLDDILRETEPAAQPAAPVEPAAQPAPAADLLDDLDDESFTPEPDPAVYAAAAAAAVAAPTAQPKRAAKPAPAKPAAPVTLPPFEGFTDFGYTEGDIL